MGELAIHLGPEFAAILIVCFILAAGAATRLLSKRLRTPYTVAMLLLGIGIGLAAKYLGGHGPMAHFSDLLAQGQLLSHDLIIFVFLPALVFESAFSMDVYAFRKELGSVLLLAVPALILCTVATAYLVFGLAGESWGWSLSAALVFGALISATDPVAVVAILRESGAPKRLGILIEGESLLNDGTAIVIFTLLLSILVAGPDAPTPGVAEVLGEFVLTVTGGVVVGLLLAIALLRWVRRTFNDAMVEITLTLVLAYSCMIFAEGFLHFSGVIAVVVAGLWVSGPGRTSISPEVTHFLHRFWELLAYLANTLIFFLVGLAIAAQLDQSGPFDLLMVLAVFGCVIAVRFAVIFLFRPLYPKLGDAISTGEATVMSWGGMRGAVSLALALAVNQNEHIPEELRHQILFLTAGVVLLTILVSGTTIGGLLRRFGFDRRPPSEELAALAAQEKALEHVEDSLERISEDRALRTLSWDEVEADIDGRKKSLHERAEQLEKELHESGGSEEMVSFWRRALAIERQAYWDAFADGTLGDKAVRVLNLEIDLHLDRLNRGRLDPPYSRIHLEEEHASRARHYLHAIERRFRHVGFDRLALLYDIARAESRAAEMVLERLEELHGEDNEALATINETYKRFQRLGKERLEEMRVNLPEITQAIEDKLTRRIALNLERDEYEALIEHGSIDEVLGKKALSGVEQRMKQLKQASTRGALPGNADLIQRVSFFAGFDDATLERIAKEVRQVVLTPGEVLFNENESGDSVFVIARGAVHVLKRIEGEEQLLAVLGGGDVFGEMAFLTGEPRTATIKAATSVVLVEISRKNLSGMMEAVPTLSEEIWQAFARHQFDTYVRAIARFSSLSGEQRMEWISKHKQIELSAGQELPASDAAFAFVLTGTLESAGTTFHAPALLDLHGQIEHPRAGTAVRVILLPPPRI